MAYDSLIVMALWLVTLFVFVTIAGAAVAGPTLQSVLFIEVFAFFTGFWVLRGQTVGMLAWRLRVVTVTGEAFTLRHGLRRFIGAVLSFATFGVGYLWKFIDPGGRTWPDLLSNTEVIFTPKG
ncbi:MAG: RDD family protein [Gammaproteobacteria bacterium]|nr:RDD family protein [Gammaproteobacteria bacterium]